MRGDVEMSLDTRHVEKNILFGLLKAQALNPVMAEIKEFNDVVFQLIATMEAEDVKLVEKQVDEYMKRLKK